MSELVLQLAIVVLIAVFVFIFIRAGRRFVSEYRRQHAPNPAHGLVSAKSINASTREDIVNAPVAPKVSILAFNDEDNRQCRVLQAPVLRRVIEARGDVVTITTIDAPTSPELMQRYHVSTVPTTVLLDASGKTYTVNYGFTNAQSLLKQIDEIVALAGAQEALS
ncbi:conjugal transfer protein TraF [Dictyobacter arantiisoli]|uniref:Thioredoxin domain-containing protein n=1 Tax=Dictyobacter arantiisoli TaxID=2014874 RepID=A0A5A5TIA6_9CHLR|nr:thioredoxin family protein [Dictyobacter arantiisoli]GCF10739.1 hypothetical protein KDI_43030 [Dictyobacter arantiisoli]